MSDSVVEPLSCSRRWKQGLIGECASCWIYTVQWKAPAERSMMSSVKALLFCIEGPLWSFKHWGFFFLFFFEDLKSFFLPSSSWLTVAKDFSRPSVRLRLNAWRNGLCLCDIFLFIILYIQNWLCVSVWQWVWLASTHTPQALWGSEIKKKKKKILPFLSALHFSLWKA